MNNKINLRKVGISKYKDGSGDHDTIAYFHEWGTIKNYNQSNDIIIEKVAIVELEDGKVVLHPPHRLKFID